MKSKNSGFTLTEVLVALVIGVISIAAAFASYGYFNKSYQSISQKAAINNSGFLVRLIGRNLCRITSII